MAGTSNPKARSFRPIGGAIAIKSVYLLITPKPLVLDSKFYIFGILGSGKIEKPPCDLGSTGPRFFANFSDIRNLLLRTSPRFFDRSDPNHCRNVLWKVIINYYRKKVKISTQFCNGAPKRWKVEGHVYEKNYNSWTKWDIFTKLDTHVNDKDLWSKKNEICRFATWWRKNTKKLFLGNCWSDRLEIWYTVSLSKGEQKTMRTFAYLKKHGRHWPNKFKHLLDKVNKGQSERNSMGMFNSWPLRSVRILKEIGH